jgi:hypothetical protein
MSFMTTTPDSRTALKTLTMPNSNTQQQSLEPQVQNRLSAKLGGDVGAAFVTATFLAPIVAIIDRSIIGNVSGKTPLIQGLSEGFKTLLTKPHHLIRQPSVLAVFTVYFGTYIVVSNISKTY